MLRAMWLGIKKYDDRDVDMHASMHEEKRKKISMPERRENLHKYLAVEIVSRGFIRLGGWQNRKESHDNDVIKKAPNAIWNLLASFGHNYMVKRDERRWFDMQNGNFTRSTFDIFRENKSRLKDFFFIEMNFLLKKYFKLM